jgi:predicted transcriptional regulator
MSELLIEKLYSLKEVAKILDVSERTVFRYINGENADGKKLRATKIGYWKISNKDLITFISKSANVSRKLYEKENFIFINPNKKPKSPKKKK